jgi:hypothetical protein
LSIPDCQGRYLSHQLSICFNTNFAARIFVRPLRSVPGTKRLISPARATL